MSTDAIPLLSFRGAKAPSGAVSVDLDRLVSSRALVQANSGAGKSRALRQLLEETHGRIQHLVLDPEGEFGTLRERFDYVLVGKEADLPATPKTARLICRKLVESGASAVVDLYALALHERREYVKLFLTELMNLPRSLWRPILVVIDEAHIFAPERGSGESQAGEAVIALCTQGRKRGYCAVLATQRISKLHKDAAAELLNKMIGRTGLDVDVKRAADELGFDKAERQRLKFLSPGEFFVYGPAIAQSVQVARTGEVVTTHPQAGAVSAAVVAPPSSKVRALLTTALADLPKEAEEEARTMEDAKRQLRERDRRIRELERSGGERVVEKPVADERAIARAVAAATRTLQERHAGVVREFRRALRTLTKSATDVSAAGEVMREALQRAEAAVVAEESAPDTAGIPAAPLPPRPTPAPRSPSVARPVVTRGDAALGKGERIVLTAIAQYPDGAEREQLTVLTGYKRSSRDTYIQRLQAGGYVEVSGATLRATDEGIAALGSGFEPLPTGEALQAYWLDRLSGGERAILEALLHAHPAPLSRDDLSELTGYKRSSRDTYLQRLQSRRLVESGGRGDVRASRVLFEEV